MIENIEQFKKELSKAIYNEMPIIETKLVPSTNGFRQYERESCKLSWEMCMEEDKDYTEKINDITKAVINTIRNYNES